MAKIIRAEFDIVQPGCVSTICGGYRRGKPLSNDVDIVFTHPNPSVLEGLCKRIVIHLVERGNYSSIAYSISYELILILNRPGYLRSSYVASPPARLYTDVLTDYAHARTQMDMREHHFDALEKALALFVLPSSSTFAQAQVREHGHVLQRRLDIIFARPEQYWCAVVGWSGSTMFQRDLRWWAKHEKEMKFDSAGITRRRDTKIYYPRSEVEVFQTLGLEYIAAEWRNADA
jgi:DNA polymerase IV